MMQRLSRADFDAAAAVTYIETGYGRQLGIRRLPVSFITRTQLLYLEPVRTAAGLLTDPLGIGFLDVECPACSVGVRMPCTVFGEEAVPHEVRAIASHQDRAARGNRGALRASIVDPPVDDAMLEYLESDPVALLDLLGKIVTVSGLGEDARIEAAQTFRAGVSGAPEASHRGEPDVSVPSREGARADS